MQGGTTRRRVVSHFSTKIPLRRYFSGPAAVGYSLLFVSLLLLTYLQNKGVGRANFSNYFSHLVPFFVIFFLEAVQPSSECEPRLPVPRSAPIGPKPH